MSQHHSQAGDIGVSTATTRRRGSVGAVAVAALLTIGSGLAGCGGDDDDAADSTAPRSTTTTPTASTEPPATTVPESAPASLAPTPGGGSTESSDTATDAGTDGTTDSTTAEADAALAAASTPADDTAPGGSEPDSGPTTTGPVCEFAENTAFPIQRCNMGPPVVVLQSILQAAQYDVSAIDGKFGDETIYAVRAFQAAEGLTVDGLVGAETWAALDVPNSFGGDDNGNGSIEPNEIDLANLGGE